jgi:hypothetical protein
MVDGKAQKTNENSGRRSTLLPMKQAYAQLLPKAFKRFSMKSAVRTGLPTLGYYLHKKPLPASERPALFTMNILPPMMTVWYHIVRKHLGDEVDITIFDCSGRLNAKEFPKARVQKFLNLYAATKSDIFLRDIAKNRKIGWICDDDMFPISSKMVDVLKEEFADENTAAVSFRPRDWWHLEIEGKSYEPMSSYCTAFNREILVEKEHLSLGPANGNTHPSHIGKSPGRYDTCDKANEILLQKGYRCAIVPKEERSEYLTGFSGVSGAVMMLYHFKNPEQILQYYEDPPKNQWGGNMLFGTLAAMLAISVVQELFTELKGAPYPLRALPKREELENLLDNHRQYLRPDQHEHEAMLRASEVRLKAAL